MLEGFGELAAVLLEGFGELAAVLLEGFGELAAGGFRVEGLRSLLLVGLGLKVFGACCWRVLG